MNVAVDGESDDVLISFQERSEPDGPLIETVIAGRDVRDDDTYLSVLFHLAQKRLKPLKLITWVASGAPEIEVPDIARLSSNSNDSHLVKSGSIGELELLTVISCLSISGFSICIKPLTPLLDVELKHRVWLAEVLAVSFSEIVVAFNGVDGLVAKL
jgi:hypothetical protein